MQLGKNPNKIIEIARTKSIKNSLKVKSENSDMCKVEILPKQILLKTQREYKTTKKAFVAKRKAKNLFWDITPTITKNSPIKALVPGTAEFASMKNKKKEENIGITVASPL